MTPSAVWRLEADLATLDLGALTAKLRITEPQLGLHEISVYGHAIAGAQLMAPSFADATPWPAPIDRFIRGGDLVVTYPFTRPRTVRAQVYWRTAPQLAVAGCLAAFDVQISVQTPLLDSQPAMSLCSRLPVGGAKRVPCAGSTGAAVPWLFRLTKDIAYAEMIHPSDVVAEDWTEEGSQTQLARRLFDGALEKGVILRARARGAFFDAEAGATAVAAVYDQFLNAPLPLTT